MAAGAKVGAGEGAGGSKRLALPVRRSLGMTEAAHARLARLKAEEGRGLSDGYLLSVLLERLDDYADPVTLRAVFDAFIDDHGAPGARPGERDA